MGDYAARLLLNLMGRLGGREGALNILEVTPCSRKCSKQDLVSAQQLSHGSSLFCHMGEPYLAQNWDPQASRNPIIHVRMWVRGLICE